MNSAIIVAAGQGTRMGSPVDKLFLNLAGRPLIYHTWRRFDTAPCIGEIILVVREERLPAFEELGRQCAWHKPFRFVVGGPERQDSVWNGLQALAPESEMVAIQDGARPCTPSALIAATLEAARETGAAVAARRVTDTIKESENAATIARTVDRSRLWSVQTPQAFRVEIIRRALSAVRARQLRVTDDTAACELIGQPVRLVESASANPKATSLADLPLLEWLLAGEAG